MRTGVSFALDDPEPAAEIWGRVIAEIETADRLGLDSVWVYEGRTGTASCPAPAALLTFAARRTRSIQLRVAGRCCAHTQPARVAEEIALLDLFSRGRAGLMLAAPAAQALPLRAVQELAEFLGAAWMLDEFRYRGAHLRFPAHTGDDAPVGVQAAPAADPYVVPWKRGAALLDYLPVTPKPYSTRPRLYAEIDCAQTAEWAARTGISPFVRAEVPLDAASALLQHYAGAARSAGRARWEVDATLERYLELDGEGDERTLGASPSALVDTVRALSASTQISHLVWRRTPDSGASIARFASEVQPLLQG